MPDQNQLEEILGNLQIQNQQLQTILLQKQALLIQDRETEKALESIEKYGDDIYKTIGPILVKTTKQDVEKELKESREEIALKMKVLERQEKRLKEKIKTGQERFQELLPHSGQGG